MSDMNFKKIVTLKLFYETSVLISTDKQKDLIQQSRTLSSKLTIYDRCMILMNDSECEVSEVTISLSALRRLIQSRRLL